MDDMEESSESEVPLQTGSIKTRELISHNLVYSNSSKSKKDISSHQQVNSDDESQTPRKRGRPSKTRMDTAVAGKGLLITSMGKHRNLQPAIQGKGKLEGNTLVNPTAGTVSKHDEVLIPNFRKQAAPPSKKLKHDALAAEPIFKQGLSINKGHAGVGIRSMGRSAPSEEESEQESGEELLGRSSQEQEHPPVKKQKKDMVALCGNKDLPKQNRPNVGMLRLAVHDKEKSQPRKHAIVNCRSLLQDAVDSSTELGDLKFGYSSDGKKDKEYRKSINSRKQSTENGARAYSDVQNSAGREQSLELQKEKAAISPPPGEFLLVQGIKKSEGLSDTSEKTHGRGRKKVASVELPPDELRCIRSDGRSWRCTAYALPGGRRCQKHLQQLVNAQKRQQTTKGPAYVKMPNGKAKLQPSDFGITNEDLKKSEFPSTHPHEKAAKKLLSNPSTNVQKSPSVSSPSTKAESVLGNSKTLIEKGAPISNCLSPKQTAKGQTKSSPDSDMAKFEQGNLCHQCQRSDKGAIVICQKCNWRRYCLCCLTRWYPDLSEQETRKACPFCRGRCTCKSCIRLKRFSKEEVLTSKTDRLNSLQHILGIILPFLKQLNEVQHSELELETALRGAPLMKLPRAPCGKDDYILCDNCGTSIVDFHRSCPDCDYDLCLTCCQELRQGKQPGAGNQVRSLASSGQQPGSEAVNQSADTVSVRKLSTNCAHDESLGKPIMSETLSNSVSEKVEVQFAQDSCQSAVWKAKKDGTIPCAPAERGCGSPLLVLKTIYRANYLENLVKEVEDFLDPSVEVLKSEGEACPFCTAENSASCGRDSSSLRLAAQRSDTNSNFIYAPHLHQAKEKRLNHFQRHWGQGEPVVVKDVLSTISDLCWEPMAMWRAIQEFTRHFVHNDSKFVTAVDCYDRQEVDVSIYEFLRGYEVGYIDHDGWPKMMKSDWPPSNMFQERLPRYYSGFLACIPFAEYTHPKKGVMNLAAKFPEGAAKPDLGPKSHIAYGVAEELGIGDSLTTLRCGVADLVCVLMHTSESKLSPWQWKQAHRARERLEAGRKAFPNRGTFDKVLNYGGTKGCTKVGLAGACTKAIAHDHSNPEDVEIHVALELSDEEIKRKGAAISQTSFMRNPIFGMKKQRRDTESTIESKGFSSDSLEKINEEENDSSAEEQNESPYVNESDDSSVAANRFIKLVVKGSAVWDVFRRQDVPKLKQYLQKYSNDLSLHGSMEVVHPIHDQMLFLNSKHKRKLKDEFQIEPWTFEQNLGEAVFVPAGCPYQIRNLKSCTKVVLDFVSPESLRESLHLTEEYRLLPRNHIANEDRLQVKKMIVHAASQAIVEIKQLKADQR